jgi:hypothetical protein
MSGHRKRLHSFLHHCKSVFQTCKRTSTNFTFSNEGRGSGADAMCEIYDFEKLRRTRRGRGGNSGSARQAPSRETFVPVGKVVSELMEKLKAR